MKKRFALIVAVLMLALCAAQNASGQWVQVGLVNHYVYAFLPNGVNLFVGTDSGVFLSTDSGTNWSAESNGLRFELPYSPNLCLIQAFAVSGTNLFAGLSSDSGGVFRSTNNGISWKEMSKGFSTNNVLNGVIAFAVIDTNLFAATGAGLFLSTNEGASWEQVENGLPTNQFVYALAVNGNDFFAGTGNVDDGGVFLSTDNGTSWTAASNGLPNTAVTPFAVTRSNLFAGVSNPEVNEGRIFQSTDSGKSWKSEDNGFPTNSGPVSSVAVSGSNLFAGVLGGGVYLLANNGKSWSAENSGLTDTNVYSLTVADGYLFAGTDSGVWRRPLSDFGISAVSNVASTENSLTSYPNPFTQSTTISFTTPESGVATVAIVNILGATVAHIFWGELDAGTHIFTWDANGLPAGMYECIVQVNGHLQRTAMELN